MSFHFRNRVEAASAFVQGPLPGDELLQCFKREMLKEPVLAVLFGGNGERIFIDRAPNMNESITPALLMSWDSDTVESKDAYFNGTIQAMIVLPTMLEGDYNRKRRLALIFQRWLTHRIQLFTGENAVAGLIEIGTNSTFRYNQLAEFSGIQLPVIPFTLNFKIDMTLFQLANPDVDFTAPIDDAILADFEQVMLEIKDAAAGSTLITDAFELPTN